MLGQLYQIKTNDGLFFPGIIYDTKNKKSIAIWLHGLGSFFASNIKRNETLATMLNKQGIAYGTFNHRGSGIISKMRISKKAKPVWIGSGFENFEKSVLDIQAIINLCKKLDYKKIFILGHSTGANKLAFYIKKTKGKGLAGIGLLGPLSDVPGFKKELGNNYKKMLTIAKGMIKNGKKDQLIPKLVDKNLFWSASRLWSIARELGPEDTFPAYNPKIKFYWTKYINKPILILIGEKDAHLVPPIKQTFLRFKKEIPSRWFSGKIITGADHSFNKHEKELAKEIVKWIKKVS